MKEEKNTPENSLTPSGEFIRRQNEFIKPGQKEMFEELKKFYFPLGDFARFLENIPPELKNDAKEEITRHFEKVIEMIKSGAFEEKA